MGVWSFIQPEGTINYVDNPSFENNITDSWANYVTGGAAGNRSQSDGPLAKFGAHGLYLQKTGGAAADRWGLQDQIAAIASVQNQDYIASAWVYSTTGALIVLRIDKGVGVGAAQNQSVTLAGPTDGWVRIETPVLTANATGDTLYVTVWVENAATVDAYFDAIQFELKDHTTTYCDGDQVGCEWRGPAHNGISQRSALSRAGGLVVDFADRNFDVEGMIGAGMSPISLNIDSFAILPGGELNSQKTRVHPFSLAGWIRGTSLTNLHAKRQQLIEDVSPNNVPGDQPVLLRYTGAAIDKEIEAYYETGLEGRIRADFECLEQAFALRFVATDPNFYEIGESSDILDENDAIATRESVSGRLRASGLWDELGPPNAAGVYGILRAICVASDHTVWWGGNFTNFDNLGAPAADYIITYDVPTATWAVVGGAFTFNNIVWDIKEAPNGDIYACGQFTEALGNRDYIAYWDGAAWQALGNPAGGGAAITSIRKMAFDDSGNLYVVGVFTTIAGVANASYVAMWDGAAWNAVGNPPAGAAAITDVSNVVIDEQGNVYVGGNFTKFANIGNADHVAMWDGAAWNFVTQLNAGAPALTIDNQNNIYVGGAFTTADGNTVNYVFRWNGRAVQTLGDGLGGGACNDLVFGPDGQLYAAGVFTSAGGLTVPGAAKWNGASWAHLDMSLVVGSNPQCIMPGPADPVIATNYDLWMGWSGPGVYNRAGDATLTNDGTEEAYPRITVTRTGGTSAILYSIRNETTGKELLFAYSLLNGETLTIDLKPTAKGIWSSFWGQRQDAILPNCDFGTFALKPGDNLITCFVDIAGAPSMKTEVIWPDPYWSFD